MGNVGAKQKPGINLNLKSNVIKVDKGIQVCLTSPRFGRSGLNVPAALIFVALMIAHDKGKPAVRQGRKAVNLPRSW